jgi:glycosyltransferase involved in cell wall biosynthesis
MISIICPTYNEEKYIVQCIESILVSDYSKDEMEVLFVDGRSMDATREITKRYIKQYPFIRLLDNPNKTVPYAMNIGIAASRGEVILRIDAHAIYPPTYFSDLTTQLEALHADNVGAVWETDVLHKNKKTLAIREILSNRFGVGNALFRIGTDKITEVDTVPFGCYKREAFERFGKYDVRLKRNQDIELNKRIKTRGGKIYLIPTIHCTYLARETFTAIMKNNFENGKWNILTVYYTKNLKSLSIRHFVPMMFVLSLFLPLLFSRWIPWSILIAVTSISVYLFVLLLVCMRLKIEKQLNLFYLLWGFMVLHFSYGIGSLTGIFAVFFSKKNR